MSAFNPPRSNYSLLKILLDGLKRGILSITNSPRLEYSALDAALDGLKGVISGSSPSDARSKFFAGQIFENYRVARTFRAVVPICMNDEHCSPEALEVMARLCFERSVLISYCHTLEGEEPLKRFEKTNDSSAKSVWGDEYDGKHSDSSSSELPKYRPMCEHVDENGDMLRVFRQLSHIAHPRSSFPACVSETTFAATGKGSARELRVERAQTALDVVARSISLSRDIAAAELLRK